jgi:DNA-binding beta-propeller fold protein YncE
MTDTALSPTFAHLKAPAHPQLLVISQQQRSVHIIDPDSAQIITTVPTHGDRPHEAAVAPDGRHVYVPIYGNAGVGKPGTDGRTIEILNLATRSFVDTIDLGRPARPHCIRPAPDGLLYLTSEVAQAVDVIDPAARKLIASIPTAQEESHMLVLTRDGKRAYTSNVRDGSVSVLDLERRRHVAVIPVANCIQRIAISPDDSTLFTTDQDAPRAAVIDTETNAVRCWIELPSIGYATVTTADGNWLLVTLLEASKLVLVDLRTMRVVKTMDVPAAPIGALLDPRRSVVYVTCFSGGNLAVIDWQKWELLQLLDAGVGADGLAWAG